jgi:1,4-dihydroxy-2-naphthoate octaprenyltransferase
MSQQLTVIRPAAERRGAGRTLHAMFMLSKAGMHQQYYSWAAAWLLFTPAVLRRPETFAAMFLFLAGVAGVISCTCSADDIVGFRSGMDADNYRIDEQVRKIQHKPLLTGELTEREAVIFCAAMGALVVCVGTAAFWILGWHAPVWAYLCYFAGAALCVQYSIGLRLSYHRGGSETLLCCGIACGMLAPYLAVEGHWSGSAGLEAVLLGLWLVMVSSYSNANDRMGDRKAGRKTLAAATRPRTFKTVMVLLFAASIGLVCALVLTMRWPWWTLLTMLPAFAAHGTQLYVGPIREQWLKARRLGLRAWNLGFLGIVPPALFMMLR